MNETAPTKYRKKPVVIEAMRLTETNAAEVKRWVESFYRGRVLMRGGPGGGSRGATLIIKTLEGDHAASVGDQVIRGVQDEAYPCKPDIFEATYEAVNTETDQAAARVSEAQVHQIADALWGDMIGASRSTVRNVLRDLFVGAGIEVAS